MSELRAGERIGGRYLLIDRLGLGGMGEVWLADLEGAGAFRRRVVIKVLAPERRGDPRIATMLADEARIVGLLHHPGIVALPEALAAQVGADVARALNAAHNACDRDGKPLHLVHRDIASDNVLISRSGAVYLGDFGVARARGNTEITDPGCAPKGKRGYMAPEQEKGDSVTPATDIYALGKVLAEAVGPDCGPGLREVIEKATRPGPEDRYQTAAELAFALGHACPLPRAPEAELAAWLQRAAPEALRHSRATGVARRDSQPPAGIAVPRPLEGPQFRAVARRRRRWPAIAGAVLGLVIGGAAVGLYFRGRVTPPDAPTGELRVTSRPGGAQIYVDGSLRGKAPMTLALPAGHHSVRVGDPKSGRWRTADVQLPAGSSGAVDVDLTE
ncbi:MAG: PEGA domain-containing protein [Deltaproteobacteria bacterium]|nr:MAG: PEGA domain-containing protein [Deltaproteobacteria bacterium]